MSLAATAAAASSFAEIGPGNVGLAIRPSCCCAPGELPDRLVETVGSVPPQSILFSRY
jgi:hypothetical protein